MGIGQVALETLSVILKVGIAACAGALVYALLQDSTPSWFWTVAIAMLVVCGAELFLIHLIHKDDSAEGGETRHMQAGDTPLFEDEN